MTLTKMIKTLKALSEKYGADHEVLHLMDYWGDEKVREVITIGHFIGWFETKADNEYFKWYSVTARFRKLQAHIEALQLPIEVKTFYQDSYDTYMAAWAERHPNEDYREWVKKQKEKKRRDWLSAVDSILGIYAGYIGNYPRFIF